MRFLGIDYGEKKIGLALGDSELKIASPLGILENKNWDFVLKNIKAICQSEEIEKVVVGLPLTMPGKIGPQAKEILKFVDFLKDELPVSVEVEDERFSSAMVNKLMTEFNVHERDAVAAMIILQSYLDKL